MSDTKAELGTWEAVIVEFFEIKRDLEEENYIKETIKSLEDAYQNNNYFDDDNIKLIFDTRKNKKEKGESSLSFQRRRAQELIKSNLIPYEISVFSKKKNYIKKIRSLLKKYKPQNWLTKNCSNASSVSFATHVIKLTHSSVDSPSLFDSINSYKNSHLTTSSLKIKAIDGAISGNQFAPIFQFLELELNGIKLAEKIAQDERVLDCFLESDSEHDLKVKWIQGFRKALERKELKTHVLAKQIYFPLSKSKNNNFNTNQEYHLLCNIISSSLAHTIYNKVFDKSLTPLKKTRDKNLFNLTPYPIITRKAHLGVTASNHGNASQLNGKRGGRLHLFSCQPPTWQSQLKPPFDKASLFNVLNNSSIKTEIEYLHDFLIRFKKLDLSIKEPKRKQHLYRWINNLIDDFLFYVGSIQNLPSGWTKKENIQLKKAHQYLLDPFRMDDDFQTERQSSDWQAIIRTDFAQWVNRRLIRKSPPFTPQAEHTRLWKKLLETPLREYMEPIELDIKQQRNIA